jgi:hypothetical protein
MSIDWESRARTAEATACRVHEALQRTCHDPDGRCMGCNAGGRDGHRPGCMIRALERALMPGGGECIFDPLGGTGSEEGEGP